MRNNCILCGKPLLGSPLYICKNMPARSQNLPTEENVNEDYPEDLNIFQCSGCGLIQLDCAPVEYYGDSTRAGERSKSLVSLCQEQFRYFIEKYNLKGSKILEIGAGMGGFIETLNEMADLHMTVIGIEKNPEFVHIARDKGCNVQKANAECEEAELIGAPFDAFFSFAFPARLVKPNAMMRLARNNLKEGGMGLIRVPSLEHIMLSGGVFDITKDHIAYYDKRTLRLLAELNGFDVLEVGEIGQVYDYIIIKKRSLMKINGAWGDIDKTLNILIQLIKAHSEKEKKVAVWCAGHFSFTVLSMIAGKCKVAYIIDNSEYKKNHYAPGSHVKIVGPEHYEKEPVDTIIILGPIYVDEIVKEIRNFNNKNIDIFAMDKEGRISAY